VGLLTKYFAKFLNRADLRVAYFGDDYALDCMEVKAINKQLKSENSKAHWDAFLVCEEMGAEDN
jgi:hypothetical protein